VLKKAMHYEKVNCTTVLDILRCRMFTLQNAHKGRPAENHPYVGYSETCDAITESVTELGNKWKVTYVRDSLHDKLTIGTDSDVELGSADKIQSRRGSRAGLLSSSIN